MPCNRQLRFDTREISLEYRFYELVRVKSSTETKKFVDTFILSSTRIFDSFVKILCDFLRFHGIIRFEEN